MWCREDRKGIDLRPFGEGDAALTCLNGGGGISDPAPGGLHKIPSLLGRKRSKVDADKTEAPLRDRQPNIRLNTPVSTSQQQFRHFLPKRRTCCFRYLRRRPSPYYSFCRLRCLSMRTPTGSPRPSGRPTPRRVSRDETQISRPLGMPLMT